MNNDNKPNAEDVEIKKDDKPEAKEVIENKPEEDAPKDALDDLFGVAPAPKAEEKKPEVDETKKEDEPEKPADGEKEKKPATDEPFARIGNQTFATKEDMVKALSSQTGYNSYLTGALRKLHPELFNPDGSLNTKEVSKVLTVEPSAKSDSKKKADETPDEEKARKDKEEAKALLRELGVIFTDSEDILTLKEQQQVIKQNGEAEAQKEIDAFTKEHPLLEEHSDALAEFMLNAKITDLARGWNSYKAANDIVEEEVKKPSDLQKPNDAGKGKSLEQTVPIPVKKTSGAAPSSGGEKDFMDDILGIKGM